MPLLTISLKCPAVFYYQRVQYLLFSFYTVCIGLFSKKVEKMRREVIDKGYSWIDVNLAPQ
jgi:hypothetical protein